LLRVPETLTGAPRDVPPASATAGHADCWTWGRPARGRPPRPAGAFESWRDFASAYPPGRPRSHFRAGHLADPEGYPQTQALEDYRTQPVIATYLERPDLEDLLGGDPVARLGDDLGTLVREAAEGALPTHALLTLDGCRLTVAGPERRRYFNDYLDTLRADAYVVRVLYHG
ncbi:hypothetical protein ABZ235_41860, partial [Streptomyces canus]|uniref:hypothetical protein n=1 Tax=Streptomyces canus TaxID=58343 RepID=UPI0033AADC19